VWNKRVDLSAGLLNICFHDLCYGCFNGATESCHVFSTISGGHLIRTLNLHSLGTAEVVEFVWTVKVPDFVRSRYTDAVVFGRILDSRVDGTYPYSFEHF
jgi:hypothetical protein